METKTKTKIVPFEVELARAIVAGEVTGKIKTRSGEDVESISFDRRGVNSPYYIFYRTKTVRHEVTIEADKSYRYINGEQPADLVIELPINDSDFSLKPFDRVLVRDSNKDRWTIDIFVRLGSDLFTCLTNYTCFTNYWRQCIPYEGNEHLFDTCDTPKKQEDEV